MVASTHVAPAQTMRVSPGRPVHIVTPYTLHKRRGLHIAGRAWEAWLRVIKWFCPRIDPDEARLVGAWLVIDPRRLDAVFA